METFSALLAICAGSPRCIHRSPVNSSHRGKWRGAFMFSLIFAWINRWVKNREVGDLRRYRAYYDVTLMINDYTQPCMLPHFSMTSISDYHTPKIEIVISCFTGSYHFDNFKSIQWRKCQNEYIFTDCTGNRHLTTSDITNVRKTI